MSAVRVGGHRGKWHSGECAFEDKWINPASKRQGRDQGKTTGTKIRPQMERRQFGRYCVTAFASSRAAIGEKVPESRPVRWVWVLRASGREKDGLVRFYCLAKACLINHSQCVPLRPSKRPPLVPPFLPPNPLSLLLFSIVSPQSPRSTTADTLKTSSPPHRRLNCICETNSASIHFTSSSFLFEGLEERFDGVGTDNRNLSFYQILITIAPETCWLCVVPVIKSKIDFNYTALKHIEGGPGYAVDLSI